MTLRVDTEWDRPNSTGESEHWLAVTVSGLPSAAGGTSYALLVDTSTSMLGGRLERARTAVAAFCAACQPADRVAVFSFASEVDRVVVASGGDDITAPLAPLAAGGKTRLDLALDAAEEWMARQPAPLRLLVLTDGDPTNAEGRRVDTAPLVERAHALARQGVRAAVIGLGGADGYDASFLRALADAGGGPSFVGVDPDLLVPRTLAALQTGVLESSEVEVVLESGDLELVEAWRVEPRVQPLPVEGRSVALPASEGGVVLLRVRLVSALAAGLGSKEFGKLSVRAGDGLTCTAPLHLRLVSPSSQDRHALNGAVDALRVRVELARTAQLRAAAEDADDQLRLTRRLADLVGQIEDPRATARIGAELHRLTAGEELGRSEREAMVEELRGGPSDG